MKVKKRYFLIPLLVLGLILGISPFIFRAHAYSVMNYTAIEHGISQNYAYIGAFSLSSYGADENEAAMIRLQYYDTDSPNTLSTFYAINIKYSATLDYWIVNNNVNVPLYNNQIYMYQIYTSNNSTLVDIYEMDYEVNARYEVIASDITLIYTSDLASYNWNEVVSVKAVFNCSLIGMTPFSSKYTLTQLLNFYNANYKLQYNNAIYNFVYEKGYSDGQEGANAISPFLNVMVTVFQGVDAVLSIELLPHISLWYFIVIPLTLMIIVGIFKILKRS